MSEMEEKLGAILSNPAMMHSTLISGSQSHTGTGGLAKKYFPGSSTKMWNSSGKPNRGYSSFFVGRNPSSVAENRANTVRYRSVQSA